MVRHNGQPLEQLHFTLFVKYELQNMIPVRYGEIMCLMQLQLFRHTDGFLWICGWQQFQCVLCDEKKS